MLTFVSVFHHKPFVIKYLLLHSFFLLNLFFHQTTIFFGFQNLYINFRHIFTESEKIQRININTILTIKN